MPPNNYEWSIAVMSEPILELINITKSFGTLIANDHINLRVERGKVHALVGENGAGKSTLMNIITDIYKADSGEIRLNGKPVSFVNPMDASAHGIGMIYQEFMLCGDLSVLDNIMLGFEEKTGIFINRKKARARIVKICEDYNFQIPLDAMVKDLPVAVLQQVEIVKVLYKGAEIIIMDEPTSVLTPQGIEGLFDAIRFLVKQGKAVIFITHKLKEVFAIADEITVLKDGRVSGNVLPDEVTEEQLCKLMVGRDVELDATKKECRKGELLLKVRDLRVKDSEGNLRLHGIDLDIHEGEIVGIAGVAGSGQRELVEAIYGMTDTEKGSVIELLGHNMIGKPPREHMMMGMGYIPQDRMGEGCARNMSIWENCIMGYHIRQGFKPRWLVDYKQVGEFTDTVIQEYKVKTKSASDKVNTLSGGNVQTLIVGREFAQDKRLYIIGDPTRGVDIGAIEFIWQKIIDIAQTGAAVLLVSHELREVMQLSDRIKVLFEGRLFDGGGFSELSDKELGILMTGGTLD